MPGRKVFNVQQVLASADVNGYLMDQTVPRFATTTERDGQWPAPPDGAQCITVDSFTRWMRVSGVWIPENNIAATSLMVQTAIGTADTVLAIGTPTLRNMTKSGNRIICTFAGLYVISYSFSFYLPNAQASGQHYIGVKLYNAGGTNTGLLQTVDHFAAGVYWRQRTGIFLSARVPGDQIEFTSRLDSVTGGPYLEPANSTINIWRIAP